MNYHEVSDIYREIIELIPFYRITKDGKPTEGIAHWPRSNNRKFRFEQSLPRTNPNDLQHYQVLEALESLS